MKIYTKTGDKGSTSLAGGKRVPKDSIRIEAYGTVDELIGWIGWIADQITRNSDKEILLEIQDRLMSCASRLACDEETLLRKMPVILEDDVQFLEKHIDRMESVLPPLTSFILPGGHPVASACHIVRSVCRRAERRVITLAQHEETEPIIIRYLNRLSDFLFVFARFLLYNSGGTELLWSPKL